KTPEGLSTIQKDYLNDLRSGHVFGADVSYFFPSNLGAGIKYNLYLSSSSVTATQWIYPNYVTGKFSDDISIYFIGPTFWIRYPSATKVNTFLMGMSIGYIGYRDYAEIPAD